MTSKSCQTYFSNTINAAKDDLINMSIEKNSGSLTKNLLDKPVDVLQELLRTF